MTSVIAETIEALKQKSPLLFSEVRIDDRVEL